MNVLPETAESEEGCATCVDKAGVDCIEGTAFRRLDYSTQVLPVGYIQTGRSCDSYGRILRAKVAHGIVQIEGIFKFDNFGCLNLRKPFKPS